MNKETQKLLKRFEKKDKIQNKINSFTKLSLIEKIKTAIKHPIIISKKIITIKPKLINLLPETIKCKLFTNDKIYIKSRDTNGKNIFTHSILYKNESELTKFLIKNINNFSCFYDIGANYGFYTILAKRLMNKGEIHSFDANPKIFKYLKKNVHIFSNVILNNKAINNKEGIIPFYLNNKHSGASSANESVINEDFKKIDIQSITIDDYIKNHKKPDIIKVDIEGGEKNFILGAQKLLTNYNPIIIMEVWSKKYKNNNLSVKAVEELLKLNYKPHLINKSGELEKINNFKNYFLFKQQRTENIVFKK
jgi:FkbM family methyltransferase